MVKLMKFFAYIAFFIFILIYFMPKISTYYFLENQLKKYDVIISGEELIDTGYSLKIKHGTVSIKAVDGAKVSDIDVQIYAFYNSVNINNIYLSSMASTFIPLKVEKANIVYSVIDPLNINAMAYGEFGEIRAKFDLLERILRVKLTPSKLMLKKYQKTLKNFKKSKKGEYIYEKNI